MDEPTERRVPVGRTSLLAGLTTLVDDERGVTLTGPGGVGKTTVALALAEAMDRPARRSTLVDLVGVTDRTTMESAVAAALDVRESGDRDLGAAIDALLGLQPTLLVLDNLELVDGAGRWIEARLGASSSLRVLGTSRIPLGYRGEVERPVPGLELPRGSSPEAVQDSPAGRLFLGAARAAGADITLDAAMARDIALLLEQLDGLPLAIELAAGRTRVLSPGSMRRRLGSPDTLARPGGTDRHRSLDAVLRWSIDLLEPGPRRLLDALSPWAGWFTLEVAEALDGSGSVISALDALVRAGLVRTTAPDEGDLRFRVLETIRAAVGHGSDDDARAAARWLSAALDGWASTLHGITPRGRAAFPHHRQAVEHLLTRLVAARDEAALELIAVSAPYFQTVGVLRETEARLRVAAASTVTTTRARAQLGLGMVREGLHGGGVGIPAIEEARVLAAGIQDAGLVLAATYWRGNTGLDIDDPEAERWLTAALELARASGRADDVLVIRARLADMGQPPADVRVSLIELLPEVRLVGDPDMLSSLLNDLAANEAMLGLDLQALEHASESSRINVEAGMELRAAWVGSIAAASAGRLGRSEEARVRLAASAATVLSAGPAAQGFILSQSLPVMTVLGHGPVAARCAGAREAHLERGRQAISQWENGLWQRDVAAARRATDAVAWQVAYEAGRREPLEAVVSTLLAALRAGAVDTRKVSTIALTTREVEVLALVGEAMSDADIGHKLFISPKTVSVHVANIKSKLALESRVEVALRARELGLVAVPP